MTSLRAISGQLSVFSQKRKKQILWLVSKLGLGTPVPTNLSLATIFVPKYNLGTSGKKLLAES
jgi:hypothetical protein